MPIWGWSDLDSMLSGKLPIVGSITPQLSDGHQGRGAEYPSEPEEIWAFGDMSETLLGGTRTNRVIGNRVEVLLDWTGILTDQLLTRPFLNGNRERTSKGWGGKVASLFFDNLLTWLGGLAADSTFRFAVHNEHQYFGSKVYYSRRMGKVYVPPEFTVRNMRKLNRVAFVFTGLLFCLSVARVVLLRLNHSRNPETERAERDGGPIGIVMGILGFLCDNLLLGLISWLDRNSALYEGLKSQVDYLENISAHFQQIEANHKSPNLERVDLVDDQAWEESLELEPEPEEERGWVIPRRNAIHSPAIIRPIINPAKFNPSSPMTMLGNLELIHRAKSSRVISEWEGVKRDAAIDAYDLKNLFATKPKKAGEGDHPPV